MGFESHTNEFISNLKRNRKLALYDVADFCREKMNYYVPVATGYLKSHNDSFVDVDRELITLSNDADYAGFVEKGTSKMESQPFITPSVYNHINDIRNIIKRRLGNGIG